MRWRCITGSSGCYHYHYYYYDHYWNTRVVNSTSFSLNVTSYGTAYEFEITVITSHGRGSPSKLTKYVPPLNGIPRDFSCQVTVDSSVITCHWSPPTDFNPAGFYVSSNMRNASLKADTHEGFCSWSMLQGHAPGAKLLHVYQRFHGYTSSSGAEFPPRKMLHDI